MPKPKPSKHKSNNPKAPLLLEPLTNLGIHWDNGKENGNYYSILGLYRVILFGTLGND